MTTAFLPALLGGPPVRPQGPPDWPLPDLDVLDALQSAYRDGSWGKYHGPHVEALEAKLAAYHQVEFAHTCASGTFAVELALRALKIGNGDEVLLAAYDFGGNFLAAHAIGAHPVLVEVSADNWNLDANALESAIGPATRALIVSHLHGGLVPMREVMAIAEARGLRVIEDAAQSPGATIQGRKAGTWGDVGILSFGGSKLLTAGRGGALLTRHADAHQRARTWQNRGNTVSPLSELQAAVLLPQLGKLDARNAQRAASVRQFCNRLHGIPGLTALVNSCRDGEPGYYKLGFQYDSTAFGMPRERFVAAVRAEGIAFDVGFRALHVGRSPKRFRQVGDLTQADRAHEGCIILHHPVLLGTASEVEEVAQAVEKVYAGREALRHGGARDA
ncbi:MAG: aminotransferase class I/II-fold pyridoxal phosphate-dependent enzyme [Gemmataceae bacterium]|nr:aminotransferase class I/II-fold pyridoxal phosphate-dependent enzyme [Gemmataceae bacterium]